MRALAESPQTLATVKILLIEDDEDDFVITRDLIAEIEWERYRLDWVNSYEAAFSEILAGEHDIYLIDYRLGDRTGVELIRESIDHGCTAPMIVLTGNVDHDVDIEAMRAGAADYLIKGRIDSATLERAIRYALERSHMMEALRESEERYELAVRGTNDGLWDWNLKTGKVYFSPRWKAMLGFAEYELDNRIEAWLERVHPEDRERVQAIVNAHKAGMARRFNQEYRILHRDGGYRWMLSRAVGVRDAKGKLARVAGSQTDITERKNVEKKLIQQALYDSLTGLPNRALFQDRLSRAIERVKRRKDCGFALLFLDVDNFKHVNDHYGHLMGDQLLIEMRQRLEKCVRPGDTIARLGGDEFTIILEDVHDNQFALRAADRMLKVLHEPFVFESQQISISTSIGIAFSSESGASAEQILSDADMAMYRAKALGKSRAIIFEHSMRFHDMVDRINFEVNLNKPAQSSQSL